MSVAEIQACPPELAQAYAFCRAVARREAKNFYWAFRALPRHKSDAMCAVYAFMRKADDLADDESISLDRRRAAMAEWTEAWRRSRTERTADPVFIALNDTQDRFRIPQELLQQLVAGTTMDLQPELEGTIFLRTDASGHAPAPREFLGYRDFDALYRYCFLVASVVGLVTIRIFGYSDARAEALAEHTGIAFQLTNILRDVREDAERGRIYLPTEDMAASHVSLDEFVTGATGGAVSLGMRGLLQREVTRAQEFYQAGYKLLPLIDADARPAMRVLVSIYHRLLQRIARDPSAVLSQRISVPTAEKLRILGKGLVSAALARLR